MAGVRRAFFWATFGRYVAMAINLTVTIVAARLVPPASFGVAVLSAAAYAIAEAIREIGGGAYLIQERELTAGKIRSSITVSLIVSLALAALLFLGARVIAGFYGVPEIEHYLHVAALGFVLGPFVFPALALMSRELAFTARLMSALPQSQTIPSSPSGYDRKVTNLDQDLTTFDSKGYSSGARVSQTVGG